MLPSCQHWWIIATPNGPTLHGICRKCGEQREFPAAGPTGPWQIEEGRRAKDAVPASRSAWAKNGSAS